MRIGGPCFPDPRRRLRGSRSLRRKRGSCASGCPWHPCSVVAVPGSWSTAMIAWTVFSLGHLCRSGQRGWCSARLRRALRARWGRTLRKRGAARWCRRGGLASTPHRARWASRGYWAMPRARRAARVGYRADRARAFAEAIRSWPGVLFGPSASVADGWVPVGPRRCGRGHRGTGRRQQARGVRPELSVARPHVDRHRPITAPSSLSVAPEASTDQP